MFSEKIKTIDKKIEQNKPQYHLHRQTAKVSALLSDNDNKCDFLEDENFLPEKELLQKATKKYIEIHVYVVSGKSKLVLQRHNIKN